MQGSIKRRFKGSWTIRVDAGWELDPSTGKLKRKQHTVSIKGTKQEAQVKLTEILNGLHSGRFVEPSKLTLREWLKEWLEANLRPRVRASTHTRYQGIIEGYINKAPIASMPLQKIRSSHVEAYYASLAGVVSASTMTLHHAILHRALRRAVKDRLIPVNPAMDLDGKPRRSHGREDARTHAWPAPEARRFLAGAKQAGAQPGAFYALALDTGMRKGELCGLRWEDVDLEQGRVRIVQQLLSPGPEPKFGPTKTGRVRTVTLGKETVVLLKAHRRAQAELKLANRISYRDLGLVFAKEWGEVRRREDQLGQPLQANNLGQREFAKLIRKAGVRPIKFHGLRHTCATLLLQAGTPVHVVSERLGHAKVSMTMEVYAHVLPDMGREAAATLGGLLHAREEEAPQASVSVL